MAGGILEILPNAYYTVDETAAVLRISPRRVRRLLQSGLARGVRIGRDWRVLGRDLLDLPRSSEPTDAQLSQALARLSEPAFRRVWDNDEDSVYDSV